MSEWLTPKQVARAIGVSDASLKRWCDKGLLPAERTAGGHRRLPLNGVLQFLRESGRALVAPDVLGLPPTIGTGEAVIERVSRQMVEALAAGQDERFRGLALGLYLAGHRAGDICDLAIGPAFTELGSRWEHGELAVYQERRGVEIVLRLLHELRKALAAPAADAPLAVGGTLAGDPYTIPNAMVELALREAGWRAESCGTGLPAETFAAAIGDLRPRLAWCSVSSAPHGSPAATADALAVLAKAARAVGAVLVAGGRALDVETRARLDGVIAVDTLRQLVTLAQALLPGAAGGVPPPAAEPGAGSRTGPGGS